MLDKLSEELKLQREKSGITLEQMAAKTRIDKKFLEAIDEGNFSFLPELYVKAFLKQYAKTVGLVEEETVRKYQAAKEGKDFEKVMEEKPKEAKQTQQPEPKKELPKIQNDAKEEVKKFHDDTLEKKNSEDDSNKNAKIMYAAIGGTVVVIAALVFFFFIKSDNEILVEETPIDQVIEDSNQRYLEEQQISDDQTTLVATSDSLMLEIAAKETSWVYLILDDKKPIEFTLFPGSRRTVSAASSFKATLGNSGGITLMLNNTPVDFTGRSKSVRHFSLDRSGFKYLNTPPKPGQ